MSNLNDEFTIKVSGFGYNKVSQYVNSLKSLMGGIIFNFTNLIDIPIQLRYFEYRSEKNINKANEDIFEKFKESGINISDLLITNNEYDIEVLSLYIYSDILSNRYNFLKYIIFYQIVEFYFPGYVDSSFRKKIQVILKDPQYNNNKERQTNHLINLVRYSYVDSTMSALNLKEVDQLKLLINAVVNKQSFIEFIKSDKQLNDFYFGDKKQYCKLSDSRIKEDFTNEEFNASLAKRIYEIRNSVVHNKDIQYHKSIIPTNKKNYLLENDIKLLKYIIQQVFIDKSL